MPHKISFMSEGFTAVWTLVSLFFGLRWNILGVVVQVLVSLKQLLLPERLVTLFASKQNMVKMTHIGCGICDNILVRFLVRMNKHMRLKVTC